MPISTQLMKEFGYNKYTQPIGDGVERWVKKRPVDIVWGYLDLVRETCESLGVEPSKLITPGIYIGRWKESSIPQINESLLKGTLPEVMEKLRRRLFLSTLSRKEVLGNLFGPVEMKKGSPQDFDPTKAKYRTREKIGFIKRDDEKFHGYDFRSMENVEDTVEAFRSLVDHEFYSDYIEHLKSTVDKSRGGLLITDLEMLYDASPVETKKLNKVRLSVIYHRYIFYVERS